MANDICKDEDEVFSELMDEFARERGSELLLRDGSSLGMSPAARIIADKVVTQYFD